MGDRFYDGAIPSDITVLGGVNSDEETRVRARFLTPGAEKVVYLSADQAEQLASLLLINIPVSAETQAAVVAAAPELAAKLEETIAAAFTVDPATELSAETLWHLSSYSDPSLLQGHLANVHGVSPADMPRGVAARLEYHRAIHSGDDI